MNIEEITPPIAKKINGKRRKRTLDEKDIARFIALFAEYEHNPDIRSIRVYSGQGFVANAYKYRADICAIEATRDGEGNWKVHGIVVDAKRSHSAGALTTINGRAA